MDRLACVDVSALALPLSPDLRANVVTERLQRFSPEVEPATDMPGIFWLRASGLSLLYPSPSDWAHSLCNDLATEGFRARVAVGFTRFGTYALARSLTRTDRRVVVIESVSHEDKAARQVALEQLHLDPELREALARLGIKTVGTFLCMPAAGLLERFGEQTYRLHRMASGTLWTPLAAQPLEEPIEEKLILDEAIVDVIHLLFVIKGLLDPILEKLSARQEAIATLYMLFVLDTRENTIETIRPAEPTLDAAILLDLVQLQLHASRLPAGVVEIELRAQTLTATREQLTLFEAACRRDLDAGARAFARLRTEFGEGTVVRARLREGHLPEASFVWETMNKLGQAHPRKVGARTLIRRIRRRATPLPPRPRNERNDNWLTQGLEYGPVLRFVGPHIISGGWWISTVHREYHFVETRHGNILWTYYDRKRRRWYLHGLVE